MVDFLYLTFYLHDFRLDTVREINVRGIADPMIDVQKSLQFPLDLVNIIIVGYKRDY